MRGDGVLHSGNERQLGRGLHGAESRESRDGGCGDVDGGRGRIDCRRERRESKAGEIGRRSAPGRGYHGVEGRPIAVGVELQFGGRSSIRRNRVQMKLIGHDGGADQKPEIGECRVEIRRELSFGERRVLRHFDDRV